MITVKRVKVRNNYICDTCGSNIFKDEEYETQTNKFKGGLLMGHYMTKEGVATVCKNCLYWGNTMRGFNGVMGSCGNANQKQNMTFYFNKCVNFWPKHEYRK